MSERGLPDMASEDGLDTILTERDRTNLPDAGVLRRIRVGRAAAWFLLTETASGVASIVTGVPDIVETTTGLNILIGGFTAYDLHNNRTAAYEAITQPTRFFTKPDQADQ